MKTHLLTALLSITVIVGFAQSPKPVLIGIDVLKPVLSLVTPNRLSYRLVEATVKIPLRRIYLSITAGYALNRSDTLHRNILLDSRGYYLKVGTEEPPTSGNGLVMGWNGLVATCQETGSYSFRGPVFGDYVAQLPNRNRVAIGVEGFLGHQFMLSERFILRVTGRVTVADLLGPRTHESAAYFVPGMGNVVGDPLVIGAGVGIHLFYRLPSGPTTALPNNEQ